MIKDFDTGFSFSCLTDVHAEVFYNDILICTIEWGNLIWVKDLEFASIWRKSKFIDLIDFVKPVIVKQIGMSFI